MNVDFSHLAPIRKPTRKETSLYRGWVKYLSDSKLNDSEIHKRAATFAARHKKVPKE